MTVRGGRSFPLGATPVEGGVNFCVYSKHASRLELTDHRVWTSSTRVAAGQETRVTGSLERIQ